MKFPHLPERKLKNLFFYDNPQGDDLTKKHPQGYDPGIGTRPVKRARRKKSPKSRGPARSRRRA